VKFLSDLFKQRIAAVTTHRGHRAFWYVSHFSPKTLNLRERYKIEKKKKILFRFWERVNIETSEVLLIGENLGASFYSVVFN
jgi:hypothetical protein